MTVNDFAEMKRSGRRISMITCYDYWSAQIIDQSTVDCILVGDSVAMIIHGYENTIPATVEMMALHVSAVSRGALNKFIVADMPFLSVRKGLKHAMDSVETLMRAGAQAVKIEGVSGHEEIIHHIVESGVPVMGHLGLTPQSVHQLGGYPVQGRKEDEVTALKAEAKQLQELGCFSIVLECVKSDTARTLTRSLQIPTIGIGAGPDTDGQILVLHDMLDLFKNVDPRFVRHYVRGHQLVLDSLNHFDSDVKEGSFPSAEESYL